MWKCPSEVQTCVLFIPSGYPYRRRGSAFCSQQGKKAEMWLRTVSGKQIGVQQGSSYHNELNDTIIRSASTLQASVRGTGEGALCVQEQMCASQSAQVEDNSGRQSSPSALFETGLLWCCSLLQMLGQLEPSGFQHHRRAGDY